MPNAENVLVQLKRLRSLRARQASEDEPTRARRLLLSRWQNERLSRTHADLLRNPRYAPAVRYFFSDVYAGRDFSRRDLELERVSPILSGVLPDAVVATLARSLEMNALTRELDARIAQALAELGMDGSLNENLYAEGCRRSGDFAERRRQIELIRLVGTDLERIVRQPFLATALRLARAPGRAAGLGRLMDALERGRDAFAHMGAAGGFLDTIVGRETKILERIRTGRPEPFELG